MPFPATDTIALGTDVMPGNWILQAPCEKEYGWQIQKGIGLSGATVRPIGDELVVARFLVRFFNSAEWDLFQPFRAKYLSKPTFSVIGGVGYAIGITHPELNKLGVNAVVPKKQPAFTNSGKGLWIGTVEFLQYRKPRPALESPNASIPALAESVVNAADALNQEQGLHTAQITGAR